MDLRNRVIIGNCIDVLRTLPAESVHAVVTSPPYWGLRDYGVPPSIWGGAPECDHEWTPQPRREHKGRSKIPTLAEVHEKASHGDFCSKCGAWKGCFGLEPTPEAYVEHLVEICREIWRVLRPDGTFWLNLGDCFVGTNMSDIGGNANYGHPVRATAGSQARGVWKGLAPKQLVGIPWRAAFALQGDGWWLRSDIIWSKPNAAPESVEDRPKRSHEYVFLLAKNPAYFYDHEAVREPGSAEKHRGSDIGRPKDGKRNLRSVWDILTKPYRDAHFAVFPTALPEICIRAGTSECGACPTCGSPWKRRAKVTRGRREHAPSGWEQTCQCAEHTPVPCVVLDPFAGSGTTLMTARLLRRDYVGIELNPAYERLIEERLRPADEHVSQQQVFDSAMEMDDT